ncbi:MAG TPA: hypothetical protein VMV09_03650 [Candidatus Saccharimonadales bacterium]|nr:hypothetical protein [Candidatus Saccharimonadales bacterium]
MALASRIADLVTRRRRRPTGHLVRDVLMQFDANQTPTRFSLFAILASEDDQQEVREWLAEIANQVPKDLGLADRIDAATAAGISLDLIETSYAADVSQVTWQRGDPDPEGAI